MNSTESRRFSGTWPNWPNIPKTERGRYTCEHKHGDGRMSFVTVEDTLDNIAKLSSIRPDPFNLTKTMQKIKEILNEDFVLLFSGARYRIKRKSALGDDLVRDRWADPWETRFKWLAKFKIDALRRRERKRVSERNVVWESVREES